jgi:hypothetical protein
LRYPHNVRKKLIGGFMKKRFAALTLALGVGAATSPGLAEPLKRTESRSPSVASAPVKMTDEQMDKVTAGQRQEGVINVCCVTVEDVEVVKNVQVGAQAAVAVLGTAANVGGQRGIVNPN